MSHATSGSRGVRVSAMPHRATLAALAVLTAALISGCATGPDANPKDPLEPLNRVVFTGNRYADDYVLKPVAQGYTDYIPSPVRTAVGNFFSNISDVYSAANNLMQGKPTRAAEDTMRVAINSVLGIGGLIDIATPAGLPKYKEDFGQTMGVWGVPAGPYLVLPLFGPSTVRDTAGMLVDRYMDPSAYFDPVRLRNSLTGLRIVDTRSQLLGASNLIDLAALDPYSFLRDSYLQRRQYQIFDGNPPDDTDDDPGSDKSNTRPDGAKHSVEPEPGSPTLPLSPIPPAGGFRLGF